MPAQVFFVARLGSFPQSFYLPHVVLYRKRNLIGFAFSASYHGYSVYKPLAKTARQPPNWMAFDVAELAAGAATIRDEKGTFYFF